MVETVSLVIVIVFCLCANPTNRCGVIAKKYNFQYGVRLPHWTYKFWVLVILLSLS